MNDFNLDNESYDITPELIVSKIINDHSGKLWTEKNYGDIYGYDLNCFDKKSNEPIGFIEVEHCHHIIMDSPKWEHSFLKRKIYEWDNETECFTEGLKKFHDKTVYIKFNENYGLNDCICCSIDTIKTFNEKLQEKTGNLRTDKVIRTNKHNVKVAKGIHDCIEYIELFFFDSKDLDGWY